MLVLSDILISFSLNYSIMFQVLESLSMFFNKIIQYRIDIIN